MQFRLFFLFFLGLCSAQQTQTGYLAVNEKDSGNLFYWIIESQGNPTTDPVVLWVSGGPGCSGALALFYENGPWSVDSNSNLIPNPFSWHKYATVIWIDQPVMTGYSYADSSYVHDEKAVAKDMQVFFQLFFQRYPQYARQDFYIAGESYGGKYVPTMANLILEMNKNGNQPNINLKGIAVGNGVFAPFYQTPSTANLAYEVGLFNSTVYDQINTVSQQCQGAISAQNWDSAATLCSKVMSLVLQNAGNVNPMNYKDHCQIQDCFNYDNITNYLNQNSVKSNLNIPANVTWQACNFDVSFTNQDQFYSNLDVVGELLDSKVRVLIYYGDLDLVAPYTGGLQWMMNTDWNGKPQFKRATMNNWRYNNQFVGQTKAYGPFRFVRVYGGGHMTPHDQPEVSLELFRKFLRNEPF